jgi:HEAT repeat protein
MRLLKKYPLLLTAVLLSLFAGVIYWEIVPSREPMIDGKPLSFWLDQYSVTLTGGGEGRMAQREKAEGAIRQLGTNAIPQLLQMLREQDGRLKAKLLELFQKQRFIRISYKPAWVRNYEAELGFRILGADARQAVPALVEIYERPPSSSSQASAAAALSDIGPSASVAIPSLLRGTTNSDAAVRLCAVSALGSFQSEPETVVPALIRCLSDTNVSVRTIAARSLGQFGPEARQAIPALMNAKGSLKGNVADTALKKIDPGRATAGDQ